jgi:alpha-beta hydrolase superfamily lysophospholipase
MTNESEPKPFIWQLTKALACAIVSRAVASRVLLIFLCGMSTGGGLAILYVLGHPIKVDANCAGWINIDEMFGRPTKGTTKQ